MSAQEVAGLMRQVFGEEGLHAAVEGLTVPLHLGAVKALAAARAGGVLAAGQDSTQAADAASLVREHLR